MKNKDAPRDSAGWGSEPRRLTPLDIQEKQFGSARLRTGYLMHEVDAFLDEVTDALSALLAENERLRRGAPATAVAPPTPATPAAASDADRAAVEAFLRREKGFLQDLGSLVQSHAEELKSMVRSARAESAAVMPVERAPEPPVDEAATQPPEPEPPEAMTMAPEPMEVAADQGSDLVAGASPEDDEEESAETITGVVAEEPIVLEEPQPARRSRRADDGSEGSLRELFWGEE
jgi:DivIVA domain-containing protein